MRYLFPLLVTTSLFAADSGFYIALDGGVDLGDKLKAKTVAYNYDTGFFGSGAFGYQVDKFRLELEGQYQQNPITSLSSNAAKGDLIRESQMLNVYYSGYNSSRLISTLGIGAGSSDIRSNKLTVLGTSNDFEVKNIFTYQGSFSVAYKLTDSLDFGVKYRFIVTSKQDMLEENSQSIISAGVRYLF